MGPERRSRETQRETQGSAERRRALQKDAAERRSREKQQREAAERRSREKQQRDAAERRNSALQRDAVLCRETQQGSAERGPHA